MATLKNYLEQHVMEKIPQILSGTNVCQCDQCKMDIAALALNHLPPKYFVTEQGELFSKINSLQHQFEIDVETAILNAAAQVKQNPKHAMKGKQKNKNIIIE